MNVDEFERRLARTPLRPPPTEWRDAILAAARRSRSSPRRADRLNFWESLREVFATLPRWSAGAPAPWTVLAGAASLALVLHGLGNYAERPAPVSPIAVVSPVSWPEVVAAVRAREATIASLIGSEDDLGERTSEPVPPSGQRPPRPRSDWRHPGSPSPTNALTLTA